MALMRSRQPIEQWGAVLHITREAEAITRRLYYTVEQMQETAPCDQELALELARSQVRTANAAMCAALNTLEEVCPMPSVRPPHKPAGEL